MITLHFSPQYDSGAWAGEPARETSRIGEAFVGPLGLLSDLEVRLGLTSPAKPDLEILAQYMSSAQEVAKRNPSVFFGKSLELSPLATAQELLSWRDELVLAGWNPAADLPAQLTTGAKAMLNGFAEVEKFLPEGLGTVSDRWLAVVSALESSPAGKDFRVLVHAPETHMHPIHRRVLDLLRQGGVTVEECLAEGKPETEVKHFRDSADACLWAASQSGDALLVCSDGQTLASAQAAFAHRTGSMASSQTPRPVEHVFTSAMMLLRNGDDIQAFRDYLTSPVHPLNHYKKEGRTLRDALLRKIIRQRGFEGVEDMIKEFAGGDAAVLAEIREWIPEPGKALTFERIRQMCARLLSWAKQTLAVMDEDQLAAVADMCRAMEFHCRQLGFDAMATIPGAAFLQALRTVSAPSETKYQDALVGSSPVVASIGKIAVPVGNAVWVDGSYAEVPAPLPFLCQEDVIALAETLPYVWMQNDALLLEEDVFSAGLSNIKGRLTILCCDTFCGEPREKHPFILRELGDGRKLQGIPFEAVPAEAAEKCEPFAANTVQDIYVLDPKGLELPDHESPSSLEKMFDQPFEWVVGSVLGLYEESETTLSIIEGLVAHDVIHQIYLKAADGGSKVTADAFEKVLKTDFDCFFESAVMGAGAELNLHENTLEREQLRTALRNESLPRLVDIIRSSGLTVVGSEAGFDGVDISEPGYEPLRIKGSIDMLLANAAGHYVVLDFKWAGSIGRKMREDQVKKGEDYQLALYRRAVENGGVPSLPAGTVDAQAFYMLRTGELLTAYDSFRTAKGSVPAVPPSKKTPRKDYPETVLDIHEKYTGIVRAFRNGEVPFNEKKTDYLNYKVLMGKLD